MTNTIKSSFPHLLLISVLILSCSENGEQERTERGHTGRTLDYTAVVHFLESPDAESPISSIDVAVAETNAQRQEGLMNVSELPQDKGMIFMFEREQPLSFWMANTPLPLDIIFANAEGLIVRIHRNTPPFSQQNFSSEEPAIYAVEVNAGYTSRYDIREGHYITYER